VVPLPYSHIYTIIIIIIRKNGANKKKKKEKTIEKTKIVLRLYQ